MQLRTMSKSNSSAMGPSSLWEPKRYIKCGIFTSAHCVVDVPLCHLFVQSNVTFKRFNAVQEEHKTVILCKGSGTCPTSSHGSNDNDLWLSVDFGYCLGEYGLSVGQKLLVLREILKRRKSRIVFVKFLTRPCQKTYSQSNVSCCISKRCNSESNLS